MPCSDLATRRRHPVPRAGRRRLVPLTAHAWHAAAVPQRDAAQRHQRHAPAPSRRGAREGREARHAVLRARTHSQCKMGIASERMCIAAACATNRSASFDPHTIRFGRKRKEYEFDMNDAKKDRRRERERAKAGWPRCCRLLPPQLRSSRPRDFGFHLHDFLGELSHSLSLPEVRHRFRVARPLEGRQALSSLRQRD